jgi:hypothetical protein
MKEEEVEQAKGIETFSGVLVAVSSKRLRLAFAVIGSDITSQPVGCQQFKLKKFDQLKTKFPVSKCLKVAVNLFRFVSGSEALTLLILHDSNFF